MTRALVLRAPLAPNANHKGTAFGGSLYSLAVLTGWAWLTRFLATRKLDAEAVIQESSMRFLAPVHGEMRACIEIPADAEIDKFQKMLVRADRGRIRLQVKMHEGPRWRRFLTACLPRPCVVRRKGMPGKLILVRHGQSTWNVENLFTGWHDVDLSDQGRAGGDSSGPRAASREARAEYRLYLGLEARNPHAVDDPRYHRSHVDSRRRQLAAERTPLRRAARTQQGANSRAAWRSASQALAPQLRYSAAAPELGRSAASALRSTLCRCRSQPICRRPNR